MNKLLKYIISNEYHMYKIKYIDIVLTKGKIINIPAYWWYSIKYLKSNTSVCVFKLSDSLFVSFSMGAYGDTQYRMYNIQPTQHSTRTNKSIKDPDSIPPIP